MINKHLKKCSTILLMREMQVKFIIYHYTLNKLAKIQKIDNIKYCQDMKQLNPHTLLLGMQKSITILENSLAICQLHFYIPNQEK